MAKRSYLESNREQAGNFIKAIIEGLYLMRRDKAFAVRLIKKYLRLDDDNASIAMIFARAIGHRHAA